MKMKVLRENISYNVACNILETNKYFIGGVEVISLDNKSEFWTRDTVTNKRRLVALYNEDNGVLLVVTN